MNALLSLIRTGWKWRVDGSMAHSDFVLTLCRFKGLSYRRLHNDINNCGTSWKSTLLCIQIEYGLELFISTRIVHSESIITSVPFLILLLFRCFILLLHLLRNIRLK